MAKNGIVRANSSAPSSFIGPPVEVDTSRDKSDKGNFN